MIRRPPRSTRTDTLFPYTTLFRSIIIQPVNDPPAFTSSPLDVAVVNEAYDYRIAVTDPDGDKLTMTASAKPSWASFSVTGNGQAALSGKPPESALGSTTVRSEERRVGKECVSKGKYRG